MGDDGNTEREKWTSCYVVKRDARTLIVHAYEVAGEQWKQGYQIFLKREGENNVKLLHESERNYYKREIALEAGKLFAENFDFKFEEISELVEALKEHG